MMDSLDALSNVNTMGREALLRVVAIESVLKRILEEVSEREPNHWDLADSASLAAGAITNVTVGGQAGTRVPVGKRFVLQRISTVAPAATGPCAIYATTSGQADATNLREVIAAPSLYADAVDGGGTVIRGGSVLLAVFNQVPATGGVCSIRYEGILFDDFQPGDLAH